MKTFLLFLMATTGLVAAANVGVYLQQLAEANDVFTTNMFAEALKDKPDESLILSAFSVIHPLAELALASTGESHDEILRAIGMPSDNAIRILFPLLSEGLKNVNGTQIRTASKVYIPIGYELDEAVASDLRSVFNSEVKNIDFTRSDEAAAEINQWVEDNTNNRIKDLVDSNGLDDETRAILVNAIYFKGSWSSKFDQTDTVDNEFFRSNGESLTLPTMHKTGRFKYGESENLDAKLLQIPYKGDKAAFLVILPNKVDGLNALQEKLKDTAMFRKTVEDLMFHDPVKVSLPKFKIETKTDLQKLLVKIGVTKIFDKHQAKLNRLLKTEEPMYVSKTIQKVFIEVNEDGAEAAAANEFQIDTFVSAMAPTIEYNFDANHPFLFFVKLGDIILFEGVFRP